MKWRWGIPLVPAAAGGAVAVLAARGGLSNPILYVRADFGTAALLVGLALSLLAAAGLALREWDEHADRSCEQRVDAVRGEASEERRRFLRRLDHELKNPLTAIRAGLANLGDGGEASSQREALVSVEAQVLRLSRLTSDLRKLAELEARPLETAPVDVAEFLAVFKSLTSVQLVPFHVSVSATAPVV